MEMSRMMKQYNVLILKSESYSLIEVVTYKGAIFDDLCNNHNSEIENIHKNQK